MGVSSTLIDSNGINTVGNGIGHDIELILDGDYANSIILNEYYELIKKEWNEIDFDKITLVI